MEYKSITLHRYYSSVSGYGFRLNENDAKYILEELKKIGKTYVVVTGDIKGGGELMTVCSITEDRGRYSSYYLENEDIKKFMKDHEDADNYNASIGVDEDNGNKIFIITIIYKTVGMGDKGGPGMLDAITAMLDRKEKKEEQSDKTKETKTPTLKERDS